MKRSTLLWALLAIAILLCGLVRADDAGEDEEEEKQDEEAEEVRFKLKKILGSEWYSTFNKYQFVLVLFEDPAVCGQACENALSQLRQAGMELKKEGLKKEDIYIAYADCSKQVKLCNKYDKKKFGRPVMSLFSKAVEIAEFTDGFTRDNIVDFVHKYQNKRYLYSEEEVRDYAGPVVYGIFQDFNPKEPTTEYAVFMKTAAHYFSQRMPDPEPRFALVTSKDDAKALAKKFGVTGDNAIVAVVDGVNVEYKEDADVDALNNWIFSLSIPPVIKADTTGTGYSYWKQGKPVVLFWLDYSKPIDEFVAMLKTIGQQYKGRLFILYEDGARAERHMTWFGYSGQKFPAMIAFDTSPAQKGEYTFDENTKLTKDTIVSFIEDLLHHRLKKHIRKQQTPAEDKGVVKTLVYDNWREIVMESPNDVVVFFYIPSCKFCLDFLETFASVAEELKGTPITFGKIDLDKNESPPPTSVRTFPTILFFPAGNKHQYKVFDDKRTRADLLDFYKTFASAPFEVPLTIQDEPVQDIHHYKTVNAPETEAAEPKKTEHVHNMREDIL